MATSDGRKAGVTPPMTVSAAPDDAPMLSVKAPEPDPSEQLLALQDKLAHGMGPAKFEQEFKKIQAAYFGALPFSPMHGGDRCAPHARPSTRSRSFTIARCMPTAHPPPCPFFRGARVALAPCPSPNLRSRCTPISAQAPDVRVIVLRPTRRRGMMPSSTRSVQGSRRKLMSSL